MHFQVLHELYCFFSKGFLMLGNEVSKLYCDHFGYPVEEHSNGMSPKVPRGV